MCLLFAFSVGFLLVCLFECCDVGSFGSFGSFGLWSEPSLQKYMSDK